MCVNKCYCCSAGVVGQSGPNSNTAVIIGIVCGVIAILVVVTVVVVVVLAFWCDIHQNKDGMLCKVST